VPDAHPCRPRPALANFITTANEYLRRQYPARPDDNWESLRRTLPHLFPDSARYLSASDTEFYGAVKGGLRPHRPLGRTVALTEYKPWNVLMHKVQHSVRTGELAVRKLCPDRACDATMPASGTLLSRSQTALDALDKARALYLEKSPAFHEEQNAKRQRQPQAYGWRTGTKR